MGGSNMTEKERFRWIADQILPYEGEVRTWLRRAMRGRPDGNDVIQEAYCKIASLPDYRHITSGRAYLFTVVRNLLLQQIRRERIVHIDSVGELDRIDVVDQSPSPERDIDGRNRLNHVHRLIAELPEECRLVFRLRKLENISQKEIASRLGISEHKVERLVAKGLRLILEGLARHDEQAPVSQLRVVKEQEVTSRGRQRR